MINLHIYTRDSPIKISLCQNMLSNRPSDDISLPKPYRQPFLLKYAEMLKVKGPPFDLKRRPIRRGLPWAFYASCEKAFGQPLYSHQK